MREGLNLDYSLLIPEYLLGGLAVLILFVDLMLPKVRKEILPVITAIGLIVAFCVSLAYVNTNDNFGGLFFVDDYTTFFRCFFIATTFVIVLLSWQYVQQQLKNPGEYYALLAISTVGAITMAAAKELLTAYIGLWQSRRRRAARGRQQRSWRCRRCGECVR